MQKTIEEEKSSPTKDSEITKKPAHKNRIHVLGPTRQMMKGGFATYLEVLGHTGGGRVAVTGLSRPRARFDRKRIFNQKSYRRDRAIRQHG